MKQATAAVQQAQASTRGSSFYAALRIMPPRERQAMFEIYQYCRAVDDVADEAGAFEEKLAALTQWRADIAAIYAKRAPAKLQGLANAVFEFGLQQEDLLAVLDGIEMDVRGPICAPDIATLTLYCDRVACAVGRMSVRVFGMEMQDGLDLSRHLGMALQLTNILRDLDEDATLGRLYLPKELLQDAGITGTAPAEVISHPALPQVCSALVKRVHMHFHEADSIMQRCERAHVRTPRIMSQAYHAILDALIKRGFEPPRRPVHVSKIRLGYILARNILF